MKPRPAIYASIPGAGPDITKEAGAAAALDAIADVHGWGGASAGALVSAFKAFGVDDVSIRDVITRALDDNAMIDIVPDGRMGLLQWRVIGDLCDRVLGPTARFAHAITPLVVGVSRLDTGAPRYLSKQGTPSVLVREGLTATASFGGGIITPLVQIPSLGTALNPSIEEHIDGGFTDNTCDAVWDRKKFPRVLFRFEGADKADPDPKERVRDWDIPAVAAGMLRCGLRAANRIKSVRRDTDAVTIWLPAGGGWKFNKSAKEVMDEWRQGYDAVMDQRHLIDCIPPEVTDDRI
jgi:hypothetical protein